MATPTKAQLLSLLQAEKLGSPASDAVQQYVTSINLDKTYNANWGTYATVDLPSGNDVKVGEVAFDTTLGQLVVCTSVGPVVWSPAGGGAGITDLTGDVTATGPGSAVATVEKIQGYEIATAAPSNGNVLTWSTTQNKWVPGVPALGGGGGGVAFYLNGSTAATAPTTGIPVPSNLTGTIVQELGTTLQTAIATITSNSLTQVPGAYDLVANFVTPPNSPGVTAVPAGLWNFNIWASSTGTAANQTIMQVRVYKYDGASTTLLATSDDVSIYDPTVVAQYILTVVMPAGITLLATDRIYLELRARGLQPGRSITFKFGDGTPTYVQTTIPYAAGGDLSGTYPNPTVVGLQTRPVASTAPSSGQVLTWSGSAWAPAAISNPLTTNRLYAYEGENFVDATDLWFEKQGDQPTLSASGGAASKVTGWSNGRDAVNATGRMQDTTVSTSLPGQVLTVAVAGTFTSTPTGVGMFTFGSTPMIFGGYTDNTTVPTVPTIFIAPQSGTVFAGINASLFSNQDFVYVVRYKAGEYRHTIYVQGVGTFSATSTNATAIQSSYSILAIGGFYSSGGTWGKDIACLYTYRYKTNAEMDAIRDALQAQYAI